MGGRGASSGGSRGGGSGKAKIVTFERGRYDVLTRDGIRSVEGYTVNYDSGRDEPVSRFGITADKGGTVRITDRDTGMLVATYNGRKANSQRAKAEIKKAHEALSKIRRENWSYYESALNKFKRGN